MPHQFSHEEAMFIISHARKNSQQELTDQLNAKFGLDLDKKQIAAYIKNHHIYTGRTGQFTKGHVPSNKGKHVHNPGGTATQFHPGHQPVNHKPVGSERVNVYGYVEIKVAEPKTWKMKHVAVWEAVNGSVPDGHVVIFGDGNRFNFSLGNLILISKRELLMLNRRGLIQHDAELTKSGLLVAQLIMKYTDLKKESKQDGQAVLEPVPDS